jgi:type II secretory pathway component GspD/PulD (secretin)
MLPDFHGETVPALTRAAIGEAMFTFHCWHVRSIAFFAVVLFTSGHLLYSAEPAPEALAKSAKVPTSGTVAAALSTAPAKLRFQFDSAPWKDVVHWVAEQAGLSLVTPSGYPEGTFNYTSTRDYTLAETIDLLNSSLRDRTYALVRSDRTLVLVYISDGSPPPVLVPTVPLESLDSLGESELVNVRFPMKKVLPEDVEPEIRKLLGPAGMIMPLPKSQELYVTETAGRLRMIRDLITPQIGSELALKVFRLKRAQADELLPILRQLLGIPAGNDAAADGSIRIYRVPGANILAISGRPDKVKRVTAIIEQDEAPPGKAGNAVVGDPQLAIIPLRGLDWEEAKAVLETVLADEVGMHLSSDGRGSIIALARPSQLTVIRNVLQQLRRELVPKFRVIKLTRVDPQDAADAINRVFDKVDRKHPGPQIRIDAANRRLIIRATDPQFEEIRDLLRPI